MTLFLNPDTRSYDRLGRDKAPLYVSWSQENRSQLVRVPAAAGEYKRLELRSPDSLTNPYLAFSLIIHACLDGMEQGLPLPEAANCNLFRLPPEQAAQFEKLPGSLREAAAAARGSDFIAAHIPARILDDYCR